MRRAAGALLVAIAAAGCAPKNKAQAQVEVVRVEESPEKLLARGRAFAMAGDLTRAEQYFAAALEHGGQPREVLPLLLRVCAEEKRYRACIDYAEPELRRHPKSVQLRFLVASFYTAVGDAATARAELEQVIKDKPDHASAHFALAVLLRDEHGDVVQADAHFREYLRIEPSGPHAEEARGSLLKLVVRGDAPAAPITAPPSPPNAVWRDVVHDDKAAKDKRTP